MSGCSRREAANEVEIEQAAHRHALLRAIIALQDYALLAERDGNRDYLDAYNTARATLIRYHLCSRK